jgi:hypothetical protein
MPDKLSDLRLSSAAASSALRCSRLPFLAPMEGLQMSSQTSAEHMTGDEPQPGEYDPKAEPGVVKGMIQSRHNTEYSTTL